MPGTGPPWEPEPWYLKSVLCDEPATQEASARPFRILRPSLGDARQIGTGLAQSRTRARLHVRRSAKTREQPALRLRQLRATLDAVAVTLWCVHVCANKSIDLLAPSRSHPFCVERVIGPIGLRSAQFVAGERGPADLTPASAVGLSKTLRGRSILQSRMRRPRKPRWSRMRWEH